jgi:uncharacterized protein
MERPMIADISSRRDELRELCRRFHVRRLDLFGSAAGEDFDPARSDLDFLVEFQPEALAFDIYFDLKEALEALFGRKVDLCRAERDSQSLFQSQRGELKGAALCARARHFVRPTSSVAPSSIAVLSTSIDESIK